MPEALSSRPVALFVPDSPALGPDEMPASSPAGAGPALAGACTAAAALLGPEAVCWCLACGSVAECAACPAWASSVPSPALENVPEAAWLMPAVAGCCSAWLFSAPSALAAAGAAWLKPAVAGCCSARLPSVPARSPAGGKAWLCDAVSAAAASSLCCPGWPAVLPPSLPVTTRPLLLASAPTPAGACRL